MGYARPYQTARHHVKGNSARRARSRTLLRERIVAANHACSKCERCLVVKRCDGYERRKGKGGIYGARLVLLCYPCARAEGYTPTSHHARRETAPHSIRVALEDHFDPDFAEGDDER